MIPFFAQNVYLEKSFGLNIFPKRNKIENKTAKANNLKKFKAGRDYITNQIAVRFKKKVSKRKIKKLSKKLNLKLKKVISKLDIYIFNIPKKSNVKKFIDIFSGLEDIKYAEPNFVGKYHSDPNDTYWPTRTFFANYDDLWGLKKIQTQDAWQQTTGSASITVALLDSGISFGHEDTVENIWSNTDEIAGNGIDDDANGYVDDSRGYDFFNNDYNALDDYGHGSHVSGTIGAVGNNEKGVVGVSWNVKIMSLKIGGPSGINTLDAAEALIYAADNGAKIVNISWEAPSNQTLTNAITYASSKGLTIVASAGNSNSSTLLSPANDPRVIAVSATDYQDNRWVGSNYGSKVELAAPGVNILSIKSTYGNGIGIIVNPEADKYSRYSYATGTSMAAPHVSGLAALILSVNPSLTNSQLRQVLQESVDDLGAAGKDDYFGYGRINADKALAHPLVDKVAPATTAEVTGTLGDNGWYTSDVNVTLSTTDSNSGVKETKYRINSGGWNNYSTPVSITNEGATTFEYYSIDNANNSEEVKTKTVKIDKTSPEISITSPLNGAIVSGIVDINADVTDINGIQKVEFYLDGVLKNTDISAPYGFSEDSTLITNGNHTIKAQAYDVAGNSNSSEISVIISNVLNLIKNGSFEIDVNSDGMPDNWVSYYFATSDGINTDYVKEGTYSIKVIGDKTKGKNFRQRIQVDGKAGDTLVFSGWNKAIGATSYGRCVRAFVYLNNKDGSRTYRSIPFLKNTHDWIYRSITFTADKDYYSADIIVGYFNQYGVGYFDDFKLIKQ